MNDILVAITMADGHLQIMTLVVNGRGSVLPENAVWSNVPGYWFRDPTDVVIQSEVDKACYGQSVASWRRIERSALSTHDRTYRNAWMDDGKSIVHNMEKAKEIHRNHIRKHRKAKLAELDAQWMKAMGGDDKAAAKAVETQRQVLRDAPADPRIAAAKTTDDLKAI